MSDKQKKLSAIIALAAGFAGPYAIFSLLKAFNIDNPYLEFIFLMSGLAAIIYGIAMLVHLSKHKSNVRYVGCLSSRTFHRPSCRSVKMMQRENMMMYGPEITSQQLISNGMQPCSKCKPR